jgi:hypothetical protein
MNISTTNRSSRWAPLFGLTFASVLMLSAVAFYAATTPDPLLPTNANANQGLTPTLSWSTATGLGTITYHLQVATASDFLSGIVYDNSTLTLTSQLLSTLSSNTTYYWHVVALDDGAPGTYSTTWSFETGEMPLGTAANFGILAAGAILGGPTTVTGNIGTNAGGVSLITPEAGYLVYDYSVPGDKSIVDAGQADLAAVFADANARPGSVAIAADLGGQTLTPGVYNIVGDAAMSSNMTFNGHGVYIIQLGSFLTTTGGVTVNLSGGALWTDIFWVVNNYVSLGAGTAFEGTVMATNYISVGASVTPLSGRLLSTGAAVTVGSSTLLPVELVSFTATANRTSANLRWSTATEVNNYGFDVERRRTSEWEKIGFVPGVGTSSSPRYYSYTDNNLSNGRYVYRIKQVNKDGSFSYRGMAEVEIVSAPEAFALIQNYPNPFNPSTRIQYSLEKAGPVSLKVYNVLGAEVATLVNGPQEAGSYTVPFTAQGLASGVYFYRLESGSFVSTKKLILMK